MRFLKTKALALSLFSILASDAFAACKYTNSINTQPMHINAGNTRYSFIWLSNTSKESVEVSLKVYDQNGTDVSTSVINGGNPVITIPSKGSTGYYLLGNGATRTVHGRLTWTSNECINRPLLGNIETQWGNVGGIMSVPLQQGKRF